jgi:D-alanyl-D-alanine endopeptidase (penicillin-binding protein 7)
LEAIPGTSALDSDTVTDGLEERMNKHRLMPNAVWGALASVVVLVSAAPSDAGDQLPAWGGDFAPPMEGLLLTGPSSTPTQLAREGSRKAKPGPGPGLRSASVMVTHHRSGEIVFRKNARQQRPIASVTKLMTAMVALDRKLPLDEVLTISGDDIDRVKNSRSRLRVGSRLSRRELLRLALMSSENRAASALARTDPRGRAAFIRAMNEKARRLGMKSTHFVDSTGLRSANVSSAEDLVKMVRKAYRYPLIRQMTTTPSHEVFVRNRARPLQYINTNLLVRNRRWEIGLSKTGYIRESGRCLVMQATLFDEPFIIVLLNSAGKLTPVGDANRLKKWLGRTQAYRVSDTYTG